MYVCVAQVTLHDCLACSGCITSAETVLLQQQSGDEFLSRLADPHTTVVVTVSPQSRTALAAYYGLCPSQALARLVGWLKWLGVRAVWDLTTARDLVLLEEAAEFMNRWVCMYVSAGPLPVMGSSCPGTGWVCYAEKTHGTRVLPYLSTTRSPQGAMGGLVKSLVAAAWGVTPGSLYHVTIMPCYDKKLEASRDELTTTATTTTAAGTDAAGAGAAVGGPLPEVMVRHATAAPDPLLPGVVPADDQLYSLPHGSSSGGYADFVFRTAARELWGVEVPPGPLPWRTRRNADLQPRVGAPGQSLVVARVYGFRNIQTLLQQLKRGRCPYHYVEVMACPSGCLNGGGQIKPGPGVTPQQLIEQLELLYDVAARSPADNPAVAALYGSWLGGRPGAPPARQLLHTTFREREKTVTAATVTNW
ncbi:hypothetical protein VOLCADRAFT_66610 [Volvox carteri f. nagariensis]|uniref:Iron hydrogenase small subunit domain-containing protein n=1 Tax=Volvox carteri f. nagariensis TaxID=3068 RepID=D8UBL6_VOLCA|nr:uncharacterized protein VOLCADRAFT_66610 [Volvox carteri f. nagariensis]EFJ42789.1 hypothetical protein VOLCADRAFT_66610 [Volvox carteri f. nagariensis]|eukprot:XP_002956049.1 hypothetical protein VOLCADRAFT_66610 [Volvox carteri f. nagariensis]